MHDLIVIAGLIPSPTCQKPTPSKFPVVVGTRCACSFDIYVELVKLRRAPPKDRQNQEGKKVNS